MCKRLPPNPQPLGDVNKRLCVCVCVRVSDQMPDELLYDPQVIELREDIKGLQAEFVNAHKALDAAQQQVK